MWKIGEVANYLLVSSQCVRNLEACGLLKPEVVKSSGHRLYNEETVKEFRSKYQKREFSDVSELMPATEIIRDYEVSGTKLNSMIKSGELVPAIELYTFGKRLFLRTDVANLFTRRAN